MPEPLKPGWKTSEFWLMLIAELVGFLLASGVVAVGEGTGTAGKIVGGAIALLAALGYGVNRSRLKDR